MGGGAAGAPSCETKQVLCNGACVGPGESVGDCQVKTSDVAGVFALDAESIYLSDRRNILRMPKAGGGAEIVAPIEFQTEARAIAVNDTYVYWAEGSNSGLSVRRATKTGGTPEELGTSEDEVRALIASPTRVFFTRGAAGTASEIVSVGEPGETPVVHGTTEWPYDALAVDATHVYWADTQNGGGGFLRRSPLAGGTEELIASTDTAYVPVTHGDSVYFYESLGHDLYRVKTDGTSTAEIVGDLGDMRGFSPFLSGNDTFLVYPGSANDVRAIGYDGSNPRKLVEVSKNFEAAEADASTLYVTSNGLLIAVPL